MVEQRVKELLDIIRNKYGSDLYGEFLNKTVLVEDQTEESLLSLFEDLVKDVEYALNDRI